MLYLVMHRYIPLFQYLEDFTECKAIMGYRYPETLVEEFLQLGLDPASRILDLACGPGNVANLVGSTTITNHPDQCQANTVNFVCS